MTKKNTEMLKYFFLLFDKQRNLKGKKRERRKRRETNKLV
jgi:hypothetical protein